MISGWKWETGRHAAGGQRRSQDLQRHPGIWITVAVGALAAATCIQRARWYGWLCTITAVLGVLAAIDTVSTSAGGIFANAALAVGVVLWVAVTSIVMVRTSS